MGLIFSRERTFSQKLSAILFSAGVQALILFRLSSISSRNRVLRKFRINLLFYRLNQFLCNTDIDPDAVIGRNLLLPHPSGIVIGGTAIIGENVTIMQNVTIGARNIGENHKRHATIKDGVFLGPNAALLGDITIGEYTEIGAGSIVLADVNRNQKVFGVHKNLGLHTRCQDIEYAEINACI